MIVLSAEDVRAELEAPAAIDAVEAVLTQEVSSRARAPARVTVETDHGWLRVMPGVAFGGAGRPVTGAKIIALARGGGLSYLLLLYDERSAELLAMMDASVLTQLRTGAVSAAFVRQACPGGVPDLGLFGSGFEARGQLQMIAHAVRVARARIYSRDPARREAFAREMSAALGIPVEAVENPEAVAAAPLVVLATRATAPVIEGRWFRPGAVVVSIGSTRPELREVDVETIRRAGRIIVDHTDQAAAESGDIRAGMEEGAVTESDLVELGRVLAGTLPLRVADSRLVLFKPSGTAVEDLAIGRLVYERCRRAGRGTALDFLTRKPR
jgi:ornithine cyclodeaminase/alanine dehydrogenase